MNPLLIRLLYLHALCIPDTYPPFSTSMVYSMTRRLYVALKNTRWCPPYHSWVAAEVAC